MGIVFFLQLTVTPPKIKILKLKQENYKTTRSVQAKMAQLLLFYTNFLFSLTEDIRHETHSSRYEDGLVNVEGKIHWVFIA